MLSAVIAISQAASLAHAAVVANAGFESPITFDGSPFVGSWEGFNGGGATAVNSTLFPRSGTQSLLLSISNTDNTFTGVLQDIPSLVPGQTVTYGGFHASDSSPLDVGVEVRIEWRNSVSNTEISRTSNLTTTPGAPYSLFELNSTVPTGADTARIVYALQTFSPEPTNNGRVFVDDISFTVVPEPGVALLLGVCCPVLVLMRRRAA